MSNESVLAVLRRSWWIIALYVLLAIIAVNLAILLRGSRYEASSIVTVSPFDVPTAIARQDPTTAEPARDLATQVTLARTDELYIRAADASDSELGTAGELQEDLEVSGSNAENSITFTASSDSESTASERARLIGIEFINWQTEVLNTQVDRAIDTLEADPGTGPAATQAQVARLDELRAAAAASYTLVERGSESERVSPNLLRGSALGLAIGLVIGLVAVGLREAFTASVRSAADAEELLGLPTLASLRLPREAFERPFALDPLTWDGLDLMAGLLWASHRRDSEVLTVAPLPPTDDPNAAAVAAGLAVALSGRAERVLLADLHEPAGAASSLLLSDDGVEEDGDARGVWEVSIEPQADAAEPSGPRASLEPSVILVGRDSIVDASPEKIRHSLGVRLHSNDAMVVGPRAGLDTADGVDLCAGGAVILIVVSVGRTPRRAVRSLAKQIREWPAQPIGIAVVERHKTASTNHTGTAKTP